LKETSLKRFQVADSMCVRQNSGKGKSTETENSSVVVQGLDLGLITKFQHEGILWGMEIVLGPVCASGPKNLCMGKKHIKLSQA
jgi:hypothetical protein